MNVVCEKKVVETVEDPSAEITLAEARKLDRNAEIGGTIVMNASRPTSAASPRRPPSRSSSSASTRPNAMPSTTSTIRKRAS